MDFKPIFKEFGTTLLVVLIVQLLAVMVVSPAMLNDENITASAQETYKDPYSVSVIIPIISKIAIMTILFLIGMKLNAGWILKLFFVGVIFLNTIFIMNLLLEDITQYSGILAITIGLISTIFLLVYPAWYIMSTVGVFVCASAGGLLGSFISPLPLVALLGVLALYDHFAVHISKHMITIAEGAREYSMPLAFQLPLTDIQDESCNKECNVHENTEIEEKHERFRVMGFGDAMLPATLAVSSNVFIGNITSTLVIIGTFIGGLYLAKAGMKGKPLPALPYLNTGAIIGMLFGVVCYRLI